MIKQLRRKFVLVNMLLVGVILLAVFSALFIWNDHRMQEITYASLHMALERKVDQPRNIPRILRQPDETPSFYIPTIVVGLNTSDDIVYVIEDNLEVSSEELISLIKTALEAGEERGKIRNYGLRYVIRNYPDGLKIAFADTNHERASIRNVLSTSALILCGSLIAFFLASLFLSEWALRPTARAWEQQRRFVADASHELKTPLTIILANMGILQSHRKETVDQQMVWVENTEAEAKRMKGLVEDLLFLAKSDDAKPIFDLAPVQLSDVVMNTLLTFEPVAFERKVKLDSHVQPNLCVNGSAQQIRQLIGILLDNACKYTDAEGTITVELMALGDKVKLSVQNTGTPIAQDAQQHLFERFYRADESRAREQGGYGLGLSIAKRIAENHKGKISVSSSEEEGTTFSVNLPRYNA